MGYTRDDFNGTRYQVYTLKTSDKLDFADLKGMKWVHEPILMGRVNNILLFKWLVFMYDPNSPLVEIEDIRKRSIIAANEAGFPKVKRKFKYPYDRVVLFDDSIIQPLGRKILNYCRLHRNAAYTQLVVYELSRIKNNEMLLNPETDIQDRMKLIDMNSKLTSAIDELRPKLLNGDNSDKTYMEVLNAIENEEFEYSPEQIILSEEVRQAVLDMKPYGRWNKDSKFNENDLTPDEYEELNKELNNETEDAKNHADALGVSYT